MMAVSNNQLTGFTSQYKPAPQAAQKESSQDEDGAVVPPVPSCVPGAWNSGRSSEQVLSLVG